MTSGKLGGPNVGETTVAGATPEVTLMRPRSAILGRLDHTVWTGEDEALVTVRESYEVWRGAALAADLDNLTDPVAGPHGVAVHMKSVADGCLHGFLRNGGVVLNYRLPYPVRSTPGNRPRWHSP
jgi:hypothetical protein